MRGRSKRITTSTSVMACLAVLGGAGIGGFAAGFNARADLPVTPSTTVVAALAEMPPAETVNLRFPSDWVEAASEASPRMLALASADGGITLFTPRPIYPLADASAENGVALTAEEVKAKPAAQTAAVAPTKVALASASAKPAVVAPKPVVHRSNAVLNDSQIAGIKKRLNLTPEQERYWPAVEAELRKMEYNKKGAQGGSRMASVDMSKVNIEGLKSAGFPLVMSFSDDQRRELKSLAHLLGLENVMAGL
jgi:hypothetical protein